jgi:predicted nucleic-acid-binding Zn-ribbon protein
MKKLLLSSIILISLSACFQKNEKKNNEVDISSESKNISFDSKLIVENYEKLISKYNPSVSDENWVYIISPNLIFIQNMETNRNQTPEERMGGANQCSLSTRLIRLTDGKELIYSDIFSVKKETIINAISKYLKDEKINFEESDLELTNESLVKFFSFDQNKFSLIMDGDCYQPLFDKEIPYYVIRPHLTKWMKQQLQITD